MAAWRHLLAGLVAAVGAAGAAAQVKVELARSPALECLQPAGADRSAPEYPFDEWKAQEPGRVKVQLEFTVPDGAPEVTTLEREGSVRFDRSVRDHVRSWRVPCIEPGRPVRLIKEYVFQKDERVVGSPPAIDAADTLRREASACLAHVSGNKTPGYPPLAIKQGEVGRIHAVMRFKSPADPPEVETYARSSAGRLERHIQDWAKGYRLPCLSGETVSLGATFVFILSGDPRFGFKPLELQHLLPSVKGIQQQTLALDTTRMGCPFDVRFTYLRPMLHNRVGAVGDWRPEREPLLDYLRSVELDLPQRSLDAVYADDTTITVPCLKIDLKPLGEKQ